jgi:hypothetical protein
MALGMWRYSCDHPTPFNAGRSGRPHHHLGRLKPVPAEAQRVANHPFPARNVGLDQSAPVVARGFLPTQAVVCGFMSAVAIPVILVMLSKPGFILECIFLLLYFVIIAIVLVIATLSKNLSDTNLHYGD